MSIHAITILHMEPEIAAWSLMRFKRTTCIKPKTWTLLDNCWPINRHHTSECLVDIAKLAPNSFLMTTPVNLGGHGGFNHVLSLLDVPKDDYILSYDPDSNPITHLWLEAMRDVLDADPTLAYVSLMDSRNTDRHWTFDTIAGRRVGFMAIPDMWNVTLFRQSALTKGLLSDSDIRNAPFYGHIESAMYRHVRELGMRSGYLFDVREDRCPIPHHPAYVQWKKYHAAGQYPGNFDAYCKEKGL